MNDELTPAGKPKARVRLVGEDGNAFAILGRVRRGLKRTAPPHTPEEMKQFGEDARSGDYNHLLQVVERWADEDYGDDE